MYKAIDTIHRDLNDSNSLLNFIIRRYNNQPIFFTNSQKFYYFNQFINVNSRSTISFYYDEIFGNMNGEERQKGNPTTLLSIQKNDNGYHYKYEPINPTTLLSIQKNDDGYHHKYEPVNPITLLSIQKNDDGYHYKYKPVNPITLLSIQKEEEKISAISTADTRNKTSKKPIYLAIEKGNIDQIEALIELDSNLIHKMYKNNWTLLHYAVDRTPKDKTEEVLNFLLENGLKDKINAQAKEKSTALHLAVENNNLKAVKILLESGADKNIRNNGGNIPLDIADKKGYKGYEFLI